MKKKILIILFTSDFYKCYYALNLASTFQSCNKIVSVFYAGYACNFLKKNWKHFDRKKNNNKIIKKGMTNYLDILNLCKDLKVQFFYCDTAFRFLNLKEKDLVKDIQINSLSLYNIINNHKNSQTIFI